MSVRPAVRRIAVPATGVAAALCLAACGMDVTGGSKPAAAPSIKTMSPQQRVSLATKEGAVTWYTSVSATDVTPVVGAFEKTYPGISVKVVRLSADDIPTRIIDEQKAYTHNADVVSGDSPQIAQLLQASALQPYTPDDLSPLPAGLTLPVGYRGVDYAVTTVIAYNPTVLKAKGLTPPRTWQDLTKPEYRGMFSVDPEAENWFDSLIGSMGQAKATRLLKQLGANAPVFVSSHTQAVTDVQSGKTPIAATAYGYKASLLKRQNPQSVQFINPKPLPASLTLVDVVNAPPHLYAAELFEDWLVSKQGQNAIAGLTNHTSVRPDVKNDPAVWNPVKWKPAWGRPNLEQYRYQTVVSTMKSALGVH